MLRTHAYTLYYLAGTMDRQEASDSACVARCSPCCIHPPMLKHCLYAWHSCISFDWSYFASVICNGLPFQDITFSALYTLTVKFLDEDSQKEETSAEGSGKAKGNIGQGITGHTVWHPEIHGIQQSRALAHSSGTRTYVHLYLIYDLGRSIVWCMHFTPLLAVCIGIHTVWRTHMQALHLGLLKTAHALSD